MVHIDMKEGNHPSIKETLDSMKRQKYYCNKCKSYHFVDSDIGKEHHSLRGSAVMRKMSPEFKKELKKKGYSTEKPKTKTQDNFGKWLDTFIDEKELDREKTFEFTVGGTWHYMPLGVVIDTIKTLPKVQKDKIKSTIVMIDFKAGNVMHYFEYLAKGIAQISGEGDFSTTPSVKYRGDIGYCPHCGSQVTKKVGVIDKNKASYISERGREAKFAKFKCKNCGKEFEAE